MLLLSALSCDASHGKAARSRFQRPASAALFSSPPTSPPPNASSTLLATCRALQQMLGSPPAAPSQLPTPPMSNAAPLTSPFKLRLRSRKADESANDDVPAPR